MNQHLKTLNQLKKMLKKWYNKSVEVSQKTKGVPYEKIRNLSKELKVEAILKTLIEQGTLGLALAVAVYAIVNLYRSKESESKEYRDSLLKMATEDIDSRKELNTTLKMLVDKIDEGRSRR